MTKINKNTVFMSLDTYEKLTREQKEEHGFEIKDSLPVHWTGLAGDLVESQAKLAPVVERIIRSTNENFGVLFGAGKEGVQAFLRSKGVREDDLPGLWLLKKFPGFNCPRAHHGPGRLESEIISYEEFPRYKPSEALFSSLVHAAGLSKKDLRERQSPSIYYPEVEWKTWIPHNFEDDFLNLVDEFRREVKWWSQRLL